MKERRGRREGRVRETRAAYRTRRGPKPKAEPTEWRWVEANRERLQDEYAGRWIAVAGEQVVGAGVSLTTALKQAGKKGFNEPFITAFKKAEYRWTAEVPHWL